MEDKGLQSKRGPSSLLRKTTLKTMSISKMVAQAAHIVSTDDVGEYPIVPETLSASPFRPLKPSGTGVFGVPLENTIVDNRRLPQVFSDCILFILQRRVYLEEGIFRISGSAQTVSNLKECYNDHLAVDLNMQRDEHAPTSLLKSFLRELPEPLFTRALIDEFLEAQGDEKITRELLKRLPKLNYRMIHELFDLLRIIEEREEINKMSATNLAIVFKPSLGIDDHLFNVLLRNPQLFRGPTIVGTLFPTPYNQVNATDENPSDDFNQSAGSFHSPRHSGHSSREKLSSVSPGLSPPDLPSPHSPSLSDSRPPLDTPSPPSLPCPYFPLSGASTISATTHPSSPFSMSDLRSSLPPADRPPSLPIPFPTAPLDAPPSAPLSLPLYYPAVPSILPTSDAPSSPPLSDIPPGIPPGPFTPSLPPSDIPPSFPPTGPPPSFPPSDTPPVWTPLAVAPPALRQTARNPFGVSQFAPFTPQNTTPNSIDYTPPPNASPTNPFVSYGNSATLVADSSAANSGVASPAGGLPRSSVYVSVFPSPHPANQGTI